jgi:hypothetical protein
MSRNRYLLAIALLVMVTMACGLTINIPSDGYQVGPTRTKEIVVEQPDAPVADVTLVFGAGRLKVTPGAQDALILGQATYNFEALEPMIMVNDGKVRLETGDSGISGLPRFGEDLKNDWELQLGDMPMNLTLNAGAYQSDLELGGLALQSLHISDGAADVSLRFSEPNPSEMESLRYVTGASNVRLTGLANANFASMIFRSGAGDYTLDFSGELQRDAVVNIESGISRVVMIVPREMNAKVYFKGGLSDIEHSGDWERSGDQFVLEGAGPQLIINIDLGAGSLQLETN